MRKSILYPAEVVARSTLCMMCFGMIRHAVTPWGQISYRPFVERANRCSVAPWCLFQKDYTVERIQII